MVCTFSIRRLRICRHKPYTSPIFILTHPKGVPTTALDLTRGQAGILRRARTAIGLGGGLTIMHTVVARP